MGSDAPRFPLGLIVGTPRALQAIEAAGDSAYVYISQHGRNEGGELDFAEVAMNEVAIRDGLRIFRAYKLSNGTALWIITEADRSSTCILLPEEY